MIIPSENAHPVTSNDPSESNYLLCNKWVKQNNASLLGAVCLVDIVFYLVVIISNFTWTMLNFTSADGNLRDNLPVYLYGVLVVGDLIVLFYSIHFKIFYKKFNIQVNNAYFNIYHYLRMAWSILSCLLALSIFLFTQIIHIRSSTPEAPQHYEFQTASNIFSVIYLIYAIFCFSSASGFSAAWYGLLSKDINFYFS